MLKRIVCAVIAMASPIFCQQIDWPAFFQDALSKERTVQDAAREKGLGEIIPHLCSDEAKLVIPEIPGLAEELKQDNGDVRLQASAFLCTIARFRTDSAAVLSTAIPALTSAVDDPVVQTRQNCVNALALLKPNVPVDTLPTLLRLVQGHDTAVQGGAILGLLRLSNSNAEAKQALSDILSKAGSALRKQVIEQFPSVPVTDRHLLARLGDFLSDKDLGLQRAALLTINKFGTNAAALNREHIAAFVQTSTDRNLVTMAQKLLEELNQQ